MRKRNLMSVGRVSGIGLLFAAVGVHGAQTPTANPRSQWSRPSESFAMRVLASGLESPWEVTWGPDGFLWVTERVGKRIVRINPADGRRAIALTIDEVHQSVGQDGLLGMALHPRLLGGGAVMCTSSIRTTPTRARSFLDARRSAGTPTTARPSALAIRSM